MTAQQRENLKMFLRATTEAAALQSAALSQKIATARAAVTLAKQGGRL